MSTKSFLFLFSIHLPDEDNRGVIRMIKKNFGDERKRERERRLKSKGVESKTQIVDEIILIFDADGETDEVLSDADIETRLERNRAVGHCERMIGKAFHSTERDCKCEYLQL